MDAIKDKLVKVFTEEMFQDSVYCNLSEITDHRDFWEQIKDFDSVQKVELEYEPPNFFGGKNVADRLIKDVHEETNFDKFKIILRNKKEGLRFHYEDFKEHIQRISQGAGNYIIEGIKDGVDYIFTKKTKSHIRIDIPNIEEESEESLETRFREIESINDDENI
jgi:putative NIF3 family GTP cyclohydrolase 1 type 2